MLTCHTTEIPQQRLRAQTAGWSLATTNLFAIMFSFVTPIMINGDSTKWGVKTGFLYVSCP
jgi:MFS transporter, SP family, general alpha glucoside:H+ symporter